MADTTASAILNKHLGSRAASVPSVPSVAVPISPAAPAPQMSFAAPVVLAQGDGSVKVIPGKPVAWLTPAQFAAQFGLTKSSAYRAINDGTIPPQFVEPIGKRRLRIAAAAVEHVREVWRARRDAA